VDGEEVGSMAYHRIAGKFPSVISHFALLYRNLFSWKC